MPQTLLVVDSFSIIMRAFHAFKNTNYKLEGSSTSAVFGFSQMLLNLLEKAQPDFAALAWDSTGPTFRHELYPDYKAKRPEQPVELGPQLPLIRQIANVLSIPVFEKAGFEADDVIATLASEGVKHGLNVVIASGDHDLLQLVGEHTKVLSWGQSFRDTVLYDITRFFEEYGFWPRSMCSYKALTGDPSDNIKGIRGIGDKTAKSLIQEWATIENILVHIDQITPERIKNKLQEGKELLNLNSKLIKLVDVGNIGFDLSRCADGQSRMPEAVELFKQLKFGELRYRLTNYLTRGAAPEPGEVRNSPSLRVMAPVPAHAISVIESDFKTVETRDGLQYQMF